MTDSFAAPARTRRPPGARFVARTARRTIAESLYLLTAPVTAAAGLAAVLAGLLAGTARRLVPGRPAAAAGALAPARWFAELERWRIACGPPPHPIPGCGSTWRMR
jgi:hypothetical protein